MLGDDRRGPVAAEEQRDKSVCGHQAALAALAAGPTPAAKADAWERLIEPRRCPTASSRPLGSGLWTPGQADLSAPYLERYLAEAPPSPHARPGVRRGDRRRVPDCRSIDAAPELRDDLDAARRRRRATVLRAAWRDTVDDFDRRAAACVEPSDGRAGDRVHADRTPTPRRLSGSTD